MSKRSNEKVNKNQEIGLKDISQLSVEDIFTYLREFEKLSHDFPDNEDYQYYKTTSKVFRSKMKHYGKKALTLIQNLINKEQENKSSSINLLEIDDPEEISQQYDDVIEIVDDIIERVDTFIDEAKGMGNKETIESKVTSIHQKGRVQLVYASNVIRPQEKWKHEIDNSTYPFVPKITHKPNARVPLQDVFLKKKSINKFESYPHPYTYELENLTYEDWMLEEREEIPYKGLDNVNYTWIDTKEQLEELSKKLNGVKEFAVDLEAHAYRSYQGFVCLMQISTREEDFLIDTIELRKHMSILNESFTNPAIVKVFHGADMDVQWLQRDFGIYIVNMFDTGQACRVLNFPSFSLTYLIKHYCSIVVDKQYQRADWRIRPLSDDMIRYARGDTHYLLYIYDRLRNESILNSRVDKNLLLSILNRSRDICLIRYEKEIHTEDSYLKLYNKFNVVFNPQQLRVFEGLYNWRDKTARIEDESTRYVLPNHMLFHIAEVIPEDVPSLLACCNPVPPLVKMNGLEIINIIKKSKNASNASEPSSAPIEIEEHPKRNNQEIPQDSSFVITSNEELLDKAGWKDELNLYTNISNRKAIIPELGSYGNEQTSLFFDTDSDEEVDLDTRLTAEEIKKTFSIDLFKPTFIDEEMPVQEKKPVIEEKPKEDKVFEGIPLSMKEVYKMANKSKKKKKKRARNNQSQDPSNSPQSPFILNDGSTNVDVRNKKQKKTEETSINNFMKEIEWNDIDRI